MAYLLPGTYRPFCIFVVVVVIVITTTTTLFTSILYININFCNTCALAQFDDDVDGFGKRT